MSAKRRVMGFVGAGGIGQELVVAIRKFYYSDVSAILLTIIVTVFVIDIGTGWMRGRLFGKDARDMTQLPTPEPGRPPRAISGGLRPAGLRRGWRRRP